MVDLYKWSTIIISRAGAGTVCEIMALKKRSIFIPLKIAQKNEQFHNAKEAEAQLGSLIWEEDSLENLNVVSLLKDFLNEAVDKSVDDFPNGTAILQTEINTLLKNK